MLVKTWMTQAVRSVTAKDPARAAFETMCEHNVSHLAVVDATGHLVGIVSDRDLALPAWLRAPCATPSEHIPQALPVEAVMSDIVMTVAPDDAIEDVANQILRARIHATPVVDDHEVMLGLLTMADVVCALLAREG